jgi:hypothetical protein
MTTGSPLSSARKRSTSVAVNEIILISLHGLPGARVKAPPATQSEEWAAIRRSGCRSGRHDPPGRNGDPVRVARTCRLSCVLEAKQRAQAR